MISRWLVMAPVRTAASGNTSWMLKTSGPRRTRWVAQPVRPIVSGGDMAMTRVDPPATQRGEPGERAEADETRGSAGEVALVAAGERVDPGDRAPFGALAPNPLALPTRFDGVACGTTAARSTTWISWPSAASSWTIRVITPRWARCRARSADTARRSASQRRRSWLLQRGPVDRGQRGSRCACGERLGAPQARRRSLLPDRCATTSSASAHTSASSGSTRPAPSTIAGMQVESLRPPGSRAPSPRSAARRSLRTGSERPSPPPSSSRPLRSASETLPSRRIRESVAASRRRPRPCRVPPMNTRRRSGSRHCRRHQLDEEPMVLVADW